jgi:Flp pilus assembly pilin Flp
MLPLRSKVLVVEAGATRNDDIGGGLRLPKVNVRTMGLLNFILKEETGANAVEYALLMALIATVIIAGINAFGSAVNNSLYVVASAIFHP